MAVVLIVDDSKAVIAEYKYGLALSPHQIEYRDSASDAMERLAEEPPVDLLVVDLLMTRNGVNVLEQARRLLPDLRAVVVTGIEGEFATRAAVEAGARAVYTKHGSKSALIRHIVEAWTRPEMIA